MAARNGVPSFDDIIQTTRQRRKNEALANEIFGKRRRASSSLIGGNRKPGAGPSLASRVGITKATKRSVSSAPKLPSGTAPRQLNNLLTDRSTRPPREILKSRLSRNSKLIDKTATKQSQDVVELPQVPRTPGQGIRIRGLAGPYVVIGSNFAPRTTSADIESATGSIGGEMQSCRILTSTPTVIAEMIFTERSGAENFIAAFNNQLADGRRLHVYMKEGGPSPIVSPVEAHSATSTKVIPVEPKAARLDTVDPPPSYGTPRGYSDRNARRADPEFQDGSYGFDTREESMDVDMDTNRDNRGDDVRNDRRNYVGEEYQDRGRGSAFNRGRDTRREERPDLGRGRDSGRERDNRGLYSDSLYSRPRARGFH